MSQTTVCEMSLKNVMQVILNKQTEPWKLPQIWHKKKKWCPYRKNKSWSSSRECDNHKYFCETKLSSLKLSLLVPTHMSPKLQDRRQECQLTDDRTTAKFLLIISFNSFSWALFKWLGLFFFLFLSAIMSSILRSILLRDVTEMARVQKI